MKFFIKKAAKQKLKFLQSLQQECKVGLALSLSSKYFSLSKASEMSFEKLVSMSDGKYGPIYLIYGHFVREILEDENRGKKILYEFKTKSHHHNSNLNAVFDNPWTVGMKFSTIYVDADDSKDNSHFHKITYASSNLKDILGFRVSELLGSDLNKLVPNPVSLYHKELVNTVESGGKMFMDQKMLPQMIKSRDGHVKTCLMQLRFSSTIYNTLEIICSMNFVKDQKNCCVVITDENGVICETTNAAGNFFKVGESIFLYNPTLQNIYKVRI